VSDNPITPVPATPHVAEADWFKRFPTGGTIYQRPLPPPGSGDVVANWFRRAPNGGGTVFIQPSGEEGNVSGGETETAGKPD
jgi:hypothetical protein